VKLFEHLFEILEESTKNFKIKLAGKDHPVFKAHFPNNEILPGFIQIEIIMYLLNHKIVTILKAKFFSIIKPEDIIEYYVTSINESKYKIIIKSENKKISEIVYEI
jgi:3-hydroxyacyl-[acyl-carrier-protein] dehydratase